jgi:ATP-dependent DNA helicase RecG
VQLARAEDLGTGIRNVFQYIKPYAGTVPVFREEDLFVVEVPLRVHVLEEAGTLNGILNGTLNGTLNQGQKAVLLFIIKNPGVQAKEIIDSLQIPRDTLNKYLRYLIDKHIIERRGSKRTGGYFQVKLIANR